MSARRTLGTVFPVAQPPVFDSSVLMPFLRATPNPYAVMALEVMHVANIAICLLTAFALFSSGAQPLRR
jgi:hypothetical protein